MQGKKAGFCCSRPPLHLHKVAALLSDSPHTDSPDIASPDTVEVIETRVACDGGEGALGHPQVYLNLGDGGRIDCPYCGRRFVLAEGATPASGH